MVDPNAAYGQANGPLGMAQGSEGVGNGAIGALLGGTSSGGVGGPPPGQAGATGALLDSGTFAALQAILPVIMRQAQAGQLPQQAPQKQGQPGQPGTQQMPQAAAGKTGQPSGGSSSGNNR